MENDSFGSFNTACLNKRKYDTWREAKNEAKRLKKRHGMHLKVYECLWCAHFHLGHDRRKMLRRLNKQRESE